MSETTYRLVIVGAVLVAFGLLWFGIRATDTDTPDAVHSPSARVAVEQVIPAQGDQVLRQTEIGIDLAAGYDATLALNGTVIPREQQRRVAAQNQVFFKPGDGKVVDALRAGSNCLTASVWKQSEGRGDNDQTITWCFTAA
jgi:hypothetical protein